MQDNSLNLLCLALFSLLMLYGIRPVFHQIKQKKVQHLVFGSAAALTVLWWFRTGIHPGLDVHFLWMSALSMVVGWRWALLSASIALAVLGVIGSIPFHQLGSTALIGCALPAIVTYAIYLYSYHKLPKNFFVYVFGCGFFAGMLGISLKMFGLALIFWLNGYYDWRTLSDNYLILIPLLLFPEGMLNGMTLTILTIYKPDWVATFYDVQYFDEQ